MEKQALPRHFGIMLVVMAAAALVAHVLLGMLSLWIRRLGVSPAVTVVAVVAGAWTMSLATFDSDLSLSTYADAALYLVAAVLLFDGHYTLLIPVAMVAAANRETSLLMPFLAGMSPRPSRKVVGVAVTALLAAAATHLAIRFAFGARPPRGAYGQDPGWELLRYNLRGLTVRELITSFFVVPVASVMAWRWWPTQLRRLFWLVVPAWVAIHAAASIIAETRLLLVPYFLVILPGAAVRLDAVVRPRLSPGARPRGSPPPPAVTAR